MPPLLQLRDIALTLGGEPLFEKAELSISPAERIALVGRNGSGKSTLLKIAAALTAPGHGTRSSSRPHWKGSRHSWNVLAPYSVH
jgi:ABC transport system ATP-binding/permease protein